MTSTNLSIGLAVLGGLVTVLSPCVLPILPIIISRSLQSDRYGPIALVAGLVGGFAVAGSLIGLTASYLGELPSFLRYVAIILLLFLGILSIFPKWSYRLFSYLPTNKWLKESHRLGLLGEFILGTQLGLLWTPCAGPALGAIILLAAVNHQVTSAFTLLIFYGMGAAIPLLGIAYGGRLFSQRLLKLRSVSPILQRLGGVVIISTALAIILGWDREIQIWLAPLFPSITASLRP